MIASVCSVCCAIKLYNGGLRGLDCACLFCSALNRACGNSAHRSKTRASSPAGKLFEHMVAIGASFNNISMFIAAWRQSNHASASWRHVALYAALYLSALQRRRNQRQTGGIWRGRQNRKSGSRQRRAGRSRISEQCCATTSLQSRERRLGTRWYAVGIGVKKYRRRVLPLALNAAAPVTSPPSPLRRAARIRLPAVLLLPALLPLRALLPALSCTAYFLSAFSPPAATHCRAVIIVSAARDIIICEKDGSGR